MLYSVNREIGILFTVNRNMIVFNTREMCEGPPLTAPHYSAQACVISPNFSQLGLWPRRLSIKRYHVRFRTIMVKYPTVTDQACFFVNANRFIIL